MLKLHHMNLLNEIQETTLMMNLYQQQQLQQQQQLSGGGNPLFDSFYGMGAGSGGQQFPALHPQASALKNQQMVLGALSSPNSGPSNQMQALLRQQNMLSGGGMLDQAG